jgi:uncharacterized membrane-anchored protein
MNTDSPVAATLPSGTLAAGAGAKLRALPSTPTYWFAMFAASALGTNLGDFASDELGVSRWVSFAALAAISLSGILADRRIAARSEAGYWVAIVALRAAATNVGDVLTHDFRLGYAAVAAVLFVATLAAGALTRRDDRGSRTPRIDGGYWIAMLLAGVFGTVGGDLASHTVGLYAAAGGLIAVLLAVLMLRESLAPAALPVYWLVVLAERSAGTPVGDSLASERAVGLGLYVAILVTGGVFVIGLLVRSTRPR